MPAPRPTALNPSAPTIAAPAAIFFRYIANSLPQPYEFATLASLNSCPRSVIWAIHDETVDHAPTSALPKRPPA
jgi:hypothetical protein